MRTATCKRKTGETDISLTLNLDGTGQNVIKTGVGFLDHMLTLFAAHSRIDLTVTCDGDTYVDDHHSVEDIGIALGQALAEALGDKAGICRYGNICLPMDEALVLCALDLSGRGMSLVNLPDLTEKVGTFDTELVDEFFAAVARTAGITLHIRKLAGQNTHHIIEGAFKAFARAMKQAVSMDPSLAGEIPSTKGVLA